MTITTSTYWDINGIPLNTYAFNVSTLGGGRTNVPDLRGSNITIPYRRGELSLPKIADSRDITLGMWISGVDADGVPPVDGNIEAQWQENFDLLRNIIWSDSGPVALTKRFWRGGSVVVASASVEFTRGLEPTMQSPGLAKTTVTFHMADPFFYGSPVVVELSSESDIIEVAGDVATTNIILELDGGVELINQTPSPDISISTSATAVIDVLNKRVNNVSSPALVSTSGSDRWFSLFPGDNALVCNGGDAKITYRPAYF